nr:hypothetical protein [Microlunatus antarcticus]
MPGMIERRWGRVVSIASDSAIVTPAEMIHSRGLRARARR